MQSLSTISLQKNLDALTHIFQECDDATLLTAFKEWSSLIKDKNTTAETIQQKTQALLSNLSTLLNTPTPITNDDEDIAMFDLPDKDYSLLVTNALPLIYQLLSKKNQDDLCQSTIFSQLAEKIIMSELPEEMERSLPEKIQRLQQQLQPPVSPSTTPISITPSEKFIHRASPSPYVNDKDKNIFNEQTKQKINTLKETLTTKINDNSILNTVCTEITKIYQDLIALENNTPENESKLRHDIKATKEDIQTTLSYALKQIKKEAITDHQHQLNHLTNKLNGWLANVTDPERGVRGIPAMIKEDVDRNFNQAKNTLLQLDLDKRIADFPRLIKCEQQLLKASGYIEKGLAKINPAISNFFNTHFTKNLTNLFTACHNEEPDEIHQHHKKIDTTLAQAQTLMAEQYVQSSLPSVLRPTMECVDS